MKPDTLTETKSRSENGGENKHGPLTRVLKDVLSEITGKGGHRKLGRCATDRVGKSKQNRGKMGNLKKFQGVLEQK